MKFIHKCGRLFLLELFISESVSESLLIHSVNEEVDVFSHRLVALRGISV